MDCPKASEYIFGMMVAGMKAILSKAYGVVKEFGFLLMERNSTKGNTSWIKSAAMASTHG